MRRTNTPLPGAGFNQSDLDEHHTKAQYYLLLRLVKIALQKMASEGLGHELHELWDNFLVKLGGAYYKVRPMEKVEDKHYGKRH